MVQTQVKFGTSGHRGIIDDGFTEKHVAAISAAIADYLLTKNTSNTVIIGYDPRTGNHPNDAPSYTQLIASILNSKNITCWICDNYAPTPLISWAIKKYKLQGGIILTASHNPKEYNGLKFNDAEGAPAGTTITAEIEAKSNIYLDSAKFHTPTVNLTDTEYKNFETEFASDMISNCFSALRINKDVIEKVSVAVDCRYGTSAAIWRSIAHQLSINLTLINDEPKSDFGNINPNPTILSTLDPLRDVIDETGSDLGCANDPDADRHQIIDEKGHPISPEIIACIIAIYCHENNIPFLGISSTVASSKRLRQLMTHLHYQYDETAVGFKYFKPFLKTARNNEKMGLGIESSGGFSSSFHTYEKCGFLPCIMMLMIIRSSQRPLSDWVDLVISKTGPLVFIEKSEKLTNTQEAFIINLIQNSQQVTLQNQFTQPLNSINTVDGLKLNFENGDWLLIRKSGTEPLLRIYAESTDNQQSEQYITEFLSYLHTV